MSTREPLAIVGIGCRLPGGVRGTSDLWDLLTRGTDTVRDIPTERWDLKRFYDPDPARPGKMYVRQAATIEDDVYAFDREAFSLSPKEVEAMDPQQRLLLEVALEAFEDAGFPHEQIKGSETGVFIGSFNLDKFSHSLNPFNREIIGPHTATGATMTILSARLAYQFDLRGPCLSIDTACSSSLVAFHYASQSLWSGECDMALVGGASLMLMPEYSIAMCKGKYLAPDGRSKAFSKSANGYGRGEGAGLVLLKPLSKAIPDGDRVYAVVHGTGVNQDGRTEALPVPNEDSQRNLVQKVLRNAGLSPKAIQYVEAHGTGTPKGDPIEVRALHDALSPGREPNDKCLIGSIKTNIGHLESGAGIAGVIKTALALKHRIIPPSIHSEDLNPEIPFDDYCVKVSRQISEFPQPDSPLYAGVNSFGYGGTNAHVILGEPPATETVPAERLDPKGDDRFRPVFVPFSASSELALRALAEGYADNLAEKEQGLTLRNFAANVAQHRSHRRHRIAVLCEDLEGLTQKLRAYSNGDIDPKVIEGKTITDARPKVVFVFTGMGPQWWGMGRELLQVSDVYREVIERCDEIVRDYADWSLLEELNRDEETSRITRTEYAQTANFALQAALLHCGKKWGISADAVVGHSIGEVGAAYAGGALSLEDAVKVSLVRSRLQSTKAGQGGMLAVGLSERDASSLCHRYPGRIDIAAVNSPSAVTLSGDESALVEVASELEKRGSFNKRLRVEIAYHSYQMDSLQSELEEALKEIRPMTPRIPIYSTVTAERVDRMDAAYWWRNVREAVRFGPTIERILDDGHRVFLEAGPHPVLAASIRECIGAKKVEAVSLHCLKRKEPETATLRAAFAGLYTHGVGVDWSMCTGPVHERIELPFYPWQKERIWAETPAATQYRFGENVHPLLARRNDADDRSWLTEINRQQVPYLEDHRLEGVVVFPGAAYVEAARGAQALVDESPGCTLEDVEFRNPLVIGGSDEPVLQTTFDLETRRWRIRSRPYGDHGDWTLHASGRTLEKPVHSLRQRVDFDALRESCPTPVGPEDLYEDFDRRGLNYGPCFRGIAEARLGTGQVWSRLEAPEELEDEEGYGLHPALLDAAFQSLIAAVPKQVIGHGMVVPSGIRELHYQAPMSRGTFCHGEINKSGDGSIEGRLVLFDEKGDVFARLEGFTAQVVGKGVQETERANSVNYHYRWESCEPPAIEREAFSDRTILLLGGDDHQRRDLEERLSSEGVSVLSGSGTPAEGEVHKLLDAVRTRKCTVVLLSASNQKADPSTVAKERSRLALNVMQAIVEESNRLQARLLVVALSSPSLSGSPVPCLADSGAWGLGRVFMSEHPNIPCRLILLDEEAASEGPLLVQEIGVAEASDETAWIEGRRMKQRLERVPLSKIAEPPVERQVSEHTLKMVGDRGVASITYQEYRAKELAPTEVRIRTHTAGLNFKDLMKVMGILDKSVIEGSYFGDELGMECTGVVEAIGSEVRTLKVGDWACAVAPRALGSVVVVDQLLAIPIPREVVSIEESPCYIVFGTALRALRDLARLRMGERLLLHSATGGVGFAALQYAQHVGAELFVTAGSEEKRQVLRDMGLRHVMDSRSLTFAEEVLEATNGEGVDVVLNALAGDALRRSWNLLRPYGRFVEIGKRDIADNAPLPMGKFDRNLSFFGFDLDRLTQEHPEETNRLFYDCLELFQRGVFKPPPTKVFEANDAQSAFGFMARGEHIGRISLRFENHSLPVHRAQNLEGLLSSEGSYLITGGLGGFGLAVAEWLASKGARHLILLGRSGASRPEAKDMIKRLESRGIHVAVGAVDVSRRAETAVCLQSILDEMPKLSGVIHGAMVLDDGVLTELTPERFDRVLDPKAVGAWNLHELTRDQDLDFFVMFSSISSMIGNAGQGSYVAANSFLDALAHHRRTEGLCATTINWGVLAETGAVARDDHVARHLDSQGISGFSTAQALAEFEKVLCAHPVQVGVMDVRWDRWAQVNSQAARSWRFRHLVEEEASGELAVNETLRALRVLPKDERLDAIEEIVEESVSKIVRVSRSKLSPNTPLKDLGIDSLMAVELGNTLQVHFEVAVPTMEFMKGPPLLELSRLILGSLEIESSEDDDRLARTDEMSEEELDEILAELMSEELQP